MTRAIYSVTGAYVLAVWWIVYDAPNWVTDFNIAVSPALLLATLALFLAPNRIRTVLLGLEVIYAAMTIAITSIALPVSEHDRGRQLALFMVPIFGFSFALIVTAPPLAADVARR